MVSVWAYSEFGAGEVVATIRENQLTEENLMSEHPKPTCKVVRPQATYEGKQALHHLGGIK